MIQMHTQKHFNLPFFLTNEVIATCPCPATEHPSSVGLKMHCEFKSFLFDTWRQMNYYWQAGRQEEEASS